MLNVSFELALVGYGACSVWAEGLTALDAALRACPQW
jgi:hypothetical protein